MGSSAYVTDAKGQIYQHLEYFPFGETWVEESSNTQRTPYLFTSKELDEETQLYYYGARYYDPRTSVWASTDPILESYLGGKAGMGGVYNPLNLGLYSYSHVNPVKFVDPDGNETNYFTVFTQGDVGIGIVAGTGGAAFVLDHKTLKVYQYSYWGGGLGVGALPGGADVTIQGGFVQMDKPDDLAGWGWALGGSFAYQERGFGGQVFGSLPLEDSKKFPFVKISPNVPKVVGDSVGYAAGLNAGGSIEVTKTKLENIIDIKQTP